ncbi:hypothetical protein A2V82_02295 [candidate division KSB1 bacterium RBG_16_48_16]|nr:MAG: hypothetical protein A2V82_02295 [candidate division KSB1 bacterium RBG_16_48_16]
MGDHGMGSTQGAEQSLKCSFDADFVELAHRIHDAIEAQDRLSDQLIRVNRPLYIFAEAPRFREGVQVNNRL